MKNYMMKLSTLLLFFCLVLSAAEHSFLESNNSARLDAEEPFSAAKYSYKLYGEANKDTVVLVHGFNSSLATWDNQIQELSKKYRVLVVDQPGHGGTPAQGKDYSPKKMAQGIRGLLAKLGIGKINLVGHSMGGRTAIEFAYLYPELVKSILIADMHVDPEKSFESKIQKYIEDYDLIQKNLPSHFESYKAAYNALNTYYSSVETLMLLTSGHGNADWSYDLGNRPEATFLYLSQGMTLDLAPQLKSISAPITFIAADEKTGAAVLTKVHQDRIRQLRPDIEIYEIKNSNHSVQSSAEFTPRLMQFLEKNNE